MQLSGFDKNESKSWKVLAFNTFFCLKEPLDLDELLPVLGEYGSYQKLLLWLICLPACIPCGFCAFNQLFMTDTPDDYWCNVPQLSVFNLSDAQIRDLAIPSIEVINLFKKYSSKCKIKYNVNYFNSIFKNRRKMVKFNIASVLDMQSIG